MAEVLSFQDIPYNDRLILHFLRANPDDIVTATLIKECKEECANAFQFKVCYKEVDITKNGEALHLGELETESKNLGACLKNCKRAVIFLSTVGFEIDRLIKKYSRISPSKSIVISALGSERAESLAEAFSAFLAKTYRTCPRFSPGFGDLPLSLQKDIFTTLDVTKNIGVTLNDSLIMAPSKSISAIVGILD